MPGGDTIHRTALALDRALAGAELVRFDAPRLRYRPFPSGTIVDGAEPAVEPALGHLGPDLCRDDADIDEAVRRIAPATQHHRQPSGHGCVRTGRQALPPLWRHRRVGPAGNAAARHLLVPGVPAGAPG